jgi:small subunit ribosomal protein S14
MAKKSNINRNEKRKVMVKRFAAKRLALKKTVNSPKSTAEEKQTAQSALQALPRDASPVRIRNRCQLTGRSRGNLRAFGLSRNQFRELALNGLIPGVRKASW